MKYFTKVCEMCGKEFQSKSNIERFCNDDHYGTCCICGKKFKLTSNNLKYYFDRLDRIGCSPKCRHQISLETAGLTQKGIDERRRQSMINKIDETSKYSNFIVERLKSTSHFSTSQEVVIVIDQ